MRAIIFSGALLLALVPAALAQLPQSVIDACWNDETPAEPRVGYCTRVIGGGSDNRQMADAYYARGNTYYNLGQYDRAITDYDQVIRRDPSFAFAYANRGYAYYKIRQYERAIANFDQAIRLKPDNIDIYRTRSFAYLRQQQYDRAVADADHLIALNPGDAAAYSDRCWFRALQGRNLDQALSDCNTAIRLDSAGLHHLGRRGIVHLNAGRFAASEQDFAALIALKPDAHWYFARGTARLRQGKTEAGNADLAQARKLKADIDMEAASYGIRP